MADLDVITPAAAGGDEIKPYKIHVSSRYLDLTKQKLEITRLPRESPEPASEDWWGPKPQIELLIDFWLEKYSWRDQEKLLNVLPQFRTAISIPASETPLRIHFVHIRSPHAHAVPLLLLPPFPFSNLSFGHLVPPLTHPEDATTTQPFHVVIPALPGLGFSDPLPNGVPVIATAAEMLNTLMARLEYPHYLATNAGAATASPAEIDWKLLNRLALHYQASCIGAHFIAPPLASPKMYRDPWEWTKWTVASFLQAGVLGYADEDFPALDRENPPRYHTDLPSTGPKRRRFPGPKEFGLNHLGLREPNTAAYALTDSPTGLLVFVIKGLRLLGPLVDFTPAQLITFTNLAWLPGPENAMRMWATCSLHDEDEAEPKTTTRPNVAITVFLGGKGGGSIGLVGSGNGAGASENEFPQVRLPAHEGDGGRGRYACPAWGNARYKVLFSQRLSGQAGLLAWERPEIIRAGVRGLARELLRLDTRLKPAEAATAPLAQVVVVSPEGTETVVPPLLSPPVMTGAAAGDTREELEEPPARPTTLLEVGESSSQTIAVPGTLTPEDPAKMKDPAGKTPQDEETPDTLAEQPPPLNDAAKPK